MAKEQEKPPALAVVAGRLVSAPLAPGESQSFESPAGVSAVVRTTSLMTAGDVVLFPNSEVTLPPGAFTVKNTSDSHGTVEVMGASK